MPGRRRWQDWVIAVAGVLLIVAPFAFGATSNSTALWSSAVFGFLLAGAGLVALTSTEPGTSELFAVFVGLLTIAAPWIGDYTYLTGLAVTSAVTGALAAIAGAEVTYTAPRPATRP